MIEANRALPEQRIRLLSFIQRKEYLALGVMLLITILNGLVFTFVVPPWQHYDEPTNFEYAWLIANKPGLPKAGDYDATMRRHVAASMIENGFYAKGSEPDLDTMEDPVWIGTSQIEDRPFTYWVISLPLRLFSSKSVTNQLYLGRLVSIIFYIVTVIAAWGVMQELTAKGNSLRWVFPTSLAIMPGLSNLMTSLNSDAGAIGIFSLFLWGSVRLIQRGFSALLFVVVAGLALLCLFTKITVYLALPLLGLVLVFTFLRTKTRKWAWILLGTCLLGSGLFLFTLNDAACWYRSTVQTEAIRSVSDQSIVGENVFVLNTQAAVFPSWHKPLFQPLLQSDVAALKGNPVTLGAWIWSTERGEVAEITFSDGVKIYSKRFALTTEPTFYSLSAEIGETSFRAWLMLGVESSQNEQDGRVYYDGIVIADGDRPASEAPVFSDATATEGIWGGRPFTNLVRNASGDIGTIGFRSWFDHLWSKYLPYYSGPSFNLHYLLDFQGISWHYRITARRLFTTFWGQFGWGHVPLQLGSRPYFILGLITSLSIIGAAIRIFHSRKSLPYESLFLLIVAALGVWVMAVLRGTSHLSVNRLYLPVARYAYPAIIPTLLIFTAGLLELLSAPSRYLRYSEKYNNYIFLAFMIILNIASISTIVTFYR
jgi:hypothetical protein